MSRGKNQQSDRELFRDAMKGVRRLESQEFAPLKPPPAPHPKQSFRDRQEVLAEMASAQFDHNDFECAEHDTYRQPHVSRAVMRKLRRGQFAVQAEIDLHGLSALDAKTELAKFIDRAVARGHVCVRVIHGKGRRSPGMQPILKPRVVRWLSQWNTVAAFTSARPVDGGTGAMYVLLRQR